MLPVRNCDVYHPHAGIAAEALRGSRTKEQSPIMRVIAMAANRLNLRRQRFAAVERELLNGANPPVVLCLSNYIKKRLTQYYSSLPDSRPGDALQHATDLTRFDPSSRPQAGRVETRQRLAVATIASSPTLMIAQDFLIR